MEICLGLGKTADKRRKKKGRGKKKKESSIEVAWNREVSYFSEESIDSACSSCVTNSKHLTIRTDKHCGLYHLCLSEKEGVYCSSFLQSRCETSVGHCTTIYKLQK